MRILTTAVMAALLAFPGFSALAAPADVTVSGAWARASAGPASTGAAYVAVTGGDQADRLVSASTPAADSAQVHESSMDGGVMRMRAVPTLDIPAGKTVTLSPGGYHIMMFGLHHPLKAGQSFPLTLTFEHAAPVTVSVDVRPIGAAAVHGHPAGGPMGKMDHGAMGGMPMDHGSTGSK